MFRAGRLVVGFLGACLLFSSPCWAAHRALIAPQTASVLYVDIVRGSDEYICTTPAKPCATIQAAVDRIPAVLAVDVTVHIAPGVYAEGVVIAGRISPHRVSVRLHGMPGAVLDGESTIRTGFLVDGVSGVVVESLLIRNFAGSGIQVRNSDPATIRSCVVQGNGEDGIHMTRATVRIEETMIGANGRNGVVCDRGELVLSSESGDGVTLVSNAGSGLQAIGCRVEVAGKTMIFDNGGGFEALNAGAIALNARSDVVFARNRQFDMMATCAGMIDTWQAAQCASDCSCGGTGMEGDETLQGGVTGAHEMISLSGLAPQGSCFCPRACGCTEEHFGICHQP